MLRVPDWTGLCSKPELMKEMHFMIDKNNRLFLSVRSKIHVVQLTDPVAV